MQIESAGLSCRLKESLVSFQTPPIDDRIYSRRLVIYEPCILFLPPGIYKGEDGRGSKGWCVGVSLYVL